MSSKKSNKKSTKTADAKASAVPPDVKVEAADTNTSVSPPVKFTIETKNGLEFCVDDNGNVLVLQTIENFLKGAKDHTGEYIREFASQMNEYIDRDVLGRIPVDLIVKWREAINPLRRTIQGSNCYLNCSVIQPGREFDMTVNLLGQAFSDLMAHRSKRSGTLESPHLL
jgi:hypothetical protein